MRQPVRPAERQLDRQAHVRRRELGEDGVQSLLLEGGPTLAGAFLRARLVDKLLLFLAPILSGQGPGILDHLDEPSRLHAVTSSRVGDDVLVEAYLREP